MNNRVIWRVCRNTTRKLQLVEETWGRFLQGSGLARWCTVKESTCQCRRCRDMSLIPGSGRSPGEGNGYPLQYCCLENLIDRGAWQATVHGVTKSRTQLEWLSMHKPGTQYLREVWGKGGSPKGKGGARICMSFCNKDQVIRTSADYH